VTADGRVKIIDFGLARVEAAISSAADAPTQATGETAPGTVMGTVGYMAPEQVRGESADACADMFALGCILFELLSGTRAFAGRTSADVMCAILMQAPPTLPDRVPPVPPPSGRLSSAVWRRARHNASSRRGTWRVRCIRCTN
jgi:serine/threonine protein kinase